MRFELDELITITEPADLGGCTLADLRVIRDHYQDLEHGLSYARRIVQGRLDTVTVELDRRRDGTGEDLLQRLPDALAAHTRGPGLPRPVRDVDPPEWADGIVGELDEILTPSELGELSELSEGRLRDAAERIADLERELSGSRHEMHRRIDRVQDELVGRYRSGATVDDLLT
ncbi:MAG: RsiG family protein [Microthrixaceae bacterium]